MSLKFDKLMLTKIFKISYEAYALIYTGHVSNHLVEMKATYRGLDLDITFQVNGTYKIDDSLSLKERIAIIKLLKVCWVDLRDRNIGKSLICAPCIDTEDHANKDREWRLKAYLKAGFVITNPGRERYEMYYPW